MKNTVKIALALAAGSSLLYLGLRKKNKKETFLAPDGNTYEKDQIYRTYDNKLFKNGKEFHFNTPEMNQSNQISLNQGKTHENLHQNYQGTNKEVNYHQKGFRHQ
ncbi:hypothetical protein ASG22_01395 [Chryseobacterium sp. Leaf405]|uniref:hypothetical protein n=1 Tax=Chryseobacterium sp. Leaf405 TaxID=1736367 RepID=UPI0006FD061A|nr:hypothetical protein [Chryseobacterium sp. Leaf405]KQT35702.1 hypothetical protein ASG22_01395 [Chryseobacterium sp. Leaf405]